MAPSGSSTSQDETVGPSATQTREATRTIAIATTAGQLRTVEAATTALPLSVSGTSVRPMPPAFETPFPRSPLLRAAVSPRKKVGARGGFDRPFADRRPTFSRLVAVMRPASVGLARV